MILSSSCLHGKQFSIIHNLKCKQIITPTVCFFVFLQEEFAEKIDISQQTLSRIECGKNFLTAETLEKILSVLGVKINELFVYEEEYSSDNVLEDIEKYLQFLKSNPKKLACVHKMIKEITFL